MTIEDKCLDNAVKIQEVESRCKSNEHRIDECETDIKDLREEQKTISVIANSIDKMATSMIDMKEDIKDVKAGQNQLTEKVITLENRPANETKKRIDDMINKLIWLFAGGLGTWILSQALPRIPW